MNGPLEIVKGDGPVCVDGVCWPVSADAAGGSDIDLSDSGTDAKNVATSTSTADG